MKKIFAAVAAVAVAIAMIPAAAFAEQPAGNLYTAVKWQATVYDRDGNIDFMPGPGWINEMDVYSSTAYYVEGEASDFLQRAYDFLRGQAAEGLYLLNIDEDMQYTDGPEIVYEEVDAQATNDDPVYREHTLHGIYVEDGYTITVQAGEGGSASAAYSAGYAGLNVPVTVTASDGYQVKSVTVQADEAVAVAADNSFVMPHSNVVVKVEFEPVAQPAKKTASTADTLPIGAAGTALVIGAAFILIARCRLQ